MSRALITGGAGFIGHNLADRLLADGTDVVALDNFSSSSPVPLPSDVHLIEGDVVDPPEIEGTFDFIYHLASVASPPRFLADPIGTLRAGAEGTRQMLDRAARDRSVFLLASTSEIYGDPLEHPQTEAYFGNVDITSPRSCYDEAKRYAEALTHAYRRTGTVPEVRVARIFNTYGPAMAPDDGRVVTNLLMQSLTDQPLTIYGDGSQTRSFCYVDDLVEGLLRLAASSVHDPVNLGNPREMTINQFADVVERLTGHSGREYRGLPPSDPVRRRPDITRARTLLGWEPTTDLDTGLRSTIDYLSALDR
ncbi:MAG: NAD-dependent epimerase/dehydratase family protein [Acidimicrobiia bacterium]